MRGKCAHCGAPISARYLFVELLSGLAFLGCWLRFGHSSVPLALVYCLLLSGFIAATFIDFEHFIIPDEITLGGIVTGFFCSFFVPELHGETGIASALQKSFLGLTIGGGLIYAILRAGKLLFGKQKLALAANSKVLFTETFIQLPSQQVAYEELFYRNSDVIILQAKTAEAIDRCYANVEVRLTPKSLTIGSDQFDPEKIPHLEVWTDEITVPREAMGFGDVKFMAAIGAFLGWQAVLFSLMLSSIMGATVGIILIALKKQEWSSRLPYGPYIALAAVIWIFGGQELMAWWWK